jgi:hypothetical protein
MDEGVLHELARFRRVARQPQAERVHASGVQVIQPLERVHVPAPRAVDEHVLTGGLACGESGRVGRHRRPYQRERARHDRR